MVLSYTSERLCWFCQSKCDRYVSICYSCENDIKKEEEKEWNFVPSYNLVNIILIIF